MQFTKVGVGLKQNGQKFGDAKAIDLASLDNRLSKSVHTKKACWFLDSGYKTVTRETRQTKTLLRYNDLCGQAVVMVLKGYSYLM